MACQNLRKELQVDEGMMTRLMVSGGCSRSHHHTPRKETSTPLNLPIVLRARIVLLDVLDLTEVQKVLDLLYGTPL
jgi:hypothetical protein